MLPRIGTKVVDEQLNLVGSLVDIFGPVSKPFFSVKPVRNELLSTFSDKIGQPLYTSVEDKKPAGKQGSNVNKSKTPMKPKTNRTAMHVSKSSSSKKYPDRPRFDGAGKVRPPKK